MKFVRTYISGVNRIVGVSCAGVLS